MSQSTPPYSSLSDLTARDLMGTVHGTIHTGASLSEVVERFLTGPTRHLVVLDDENRCVGVIGPRHLAEAHRVYPHPDPDAPIGALGYAPWICLNPDDDLQQCARMLVEHDLDAIPVVDDQRRVLGMVSAHDIARAAADSGSGSGSADGGGRSG